MPPTLEKLKGHIAFICVSVQIFLIYSFEISYMDFSSQNN